MIRVSLAAVATLTGGRLYRADPDRVLAGRVAIDSRAVAAGDLFAAFAGDRVDGHDHVPAAIAAGAAAVLASRPVPAPCLVVADVREALTRLARHSLAGSDPVVLGVTGSFGKTTTKDLLAGILEGCGPTVATAGSYNNELGLPLTVLRADEDTRYLVLEMGAARAGDLRHLTSVAPPRIGVVLAVGHAHVATFGNGLDAVAAAKTELVAALPAARASGTAVLNADDPRVAAMAAATEARIVTFGRNPAATITAADIRLIAGAPEFTLRTPSGSAQVRLGLLGPHQVQNALAAAAAAWSLDIPPDQIADRLTQAEPRSASRLAATTRGTDGLTVIDDAYNAFPEAMEAALRATAALAAPPTADRPARRMIAVLGEMVAQGDQSVARHERVGELLAELDFAALIAVDGPDLPFYGGGGPAAMARTATTARPAMQVRRAADRDEALAHVRELVRPGDVVLVKASHELGLSALAAELAAEPAAEGGG